MTRSGKVQVMTGVMTSVVFASIGLMLLSGDQPRAGALLLGLGVLRAVFVAQQIRAGMGTTEAPPGDSAPPER